LLLASSLDWTISLWNPNLYTEPIYQFYGSNDFVYDVKWNPFQPNIFAACDGDGNVDVWGLNNFEEPKCHY
jgi:dynein intermediate chain